MPRKRRKIKIPKDTWVRINETLEILMRPVMMLISGSIGQILTWNVLIASLEDHKFNQNKIRAQQGIPLIDYGSLTGVGFGAKAILTGAAIGQIVSPASDIIGALLSLRGTGALRIRKEEDILARAIGP